MVQSYATYTHYFLVIQRQYEAGKCVPLVPTIILKLHVIISEIVPVLTKNMNLNLIIFITGIKKTRIQLQQKKTFTYFSCEIKTNQAVRHSCLLEIIPTQPKGFL